MAAVLLAACHPVPTAAVTLLSAGLAVAWRANSWSVLLVAAAVLAGQLSIGWLDDAVDAGDDAAAGRSDKPVATGRLSAGVVRFAAGAALVACVPLSLANGIIAGTVHLVGVAAGWAYSLRLERTVWSPVPYAAAFAALPAFVHLAVTSGQWPPWWIPVAGALIGVGAHLANVLPDLEADLAAGVRGLPQRLGRRWTRLAAPLPATAAVLVLVLAPPEPPTALDWVAVAAVTVFAAVGWLLSGSGPFLAAVASAGVCVLLLMFAAPPSGGSGASTSGDAEGAADAVVGHPRVYSA